MSTNFYAEMTIVGDIAETTIKLHIGTRISKRGLSTMCGAVFPTVNAWEQFLTHNIYNVKVVDEYGSQHDTLEFIKQEFRHPQASRTQINWLNSNGYQIENAPVPSTLGLGNQHWLDGNQLFYNGEFS